MTNQVPILYGVELRYRAGHRELTAVLAWCPWCQKIHEHGCAGHKHAHCRVPGAPEAYEVVLTTTFTPEELWAVAEYVRNALAKKRSLQKKGKKRS
jgi:hypothetical protein